MVSLGRKVISCGTFQGASLQLLPEAWSGRLHTDFPNVHTISNKPIYQPFQDLIPCSYIRARCFFFSSGTFQEASMQLWPEAWRRWLPPLPQWSGLNEHYNYEVYVQFFTFTVVYVQVGANSWKGIMYSTCCTTICSWLQYLIIANGEIARWQCIMDQKAFIFCLTLYHLLEVFKE